MNKIREVPLRRVQITDAFWSERQRIIAHTAVPYMEKILRDEVPGAEKSHALENFRIAAGESKGEFYGMVFQDTDVYKWLETASYSLIAKPDPEMEVRMDAIIDVIARAQQPDGYLNTYFTLVEPDKKWTNLLECHELYSAGHMIEAAVGHYEVTGKRNLLDIAVRLADCIVNRFADTDAIPGHQEIELALMRLYRITGEKKYCDMALQFLNNRGQDPEYFKKNTPEHPGIHYGGYDIDPCNSDYNQIYAPVREQHEARGHAVRMMYMLTAMADAAEAAQDEELYAACQVLWENITQRQMYVTGGLGATAKYEAFLPDFELPNDTAYAETCASVAMAFFAQRMLNISPEGRYADMLELELYNGALSGMQLDGTRYFYVNPLEVIPGIAGVKPGYEHVLPERPRWLACACCPPNLSRLIASLGRYCWSEGDDAVYSHLFIGSRVQTRFADIEMETGYPWKGGVKYTLHPHTEQSFALAIHIPAYLESVHVQLNGEIVPAKLENGYLRIARSWQDGDCVELRFEPMPRRIYSDPRVEANTGCVALAYGPMVYCFEGMDNGENLAALRVPKDAQICIGGFNDLNVQTLTVNEKLTAIPYFAWSNRGLNEMCVWMHE
ncbi:MAG: glycoside hydrolase family 127 protein [Clostridia bacterium]|nr:glycoside hydrolase family 127 protein [Clostridia bacterium]